MKRVRITKIKAQNYRQLRDFDIDFSNKDIHDLHVIIGRNGMGKSNLLNAVNWCLYGEEPHLHKESLALPLINLETLKEHQEGDTCVVHVEVTVKEGDKEIIYIREKQFRIALEGEAPFALGENFEVGVITEDGTEFYPEEDAQIFVKQFVPIQIREYFFFDGERLNTYFVEQTGENIRKSIFEISQVQLLDTVEDRLIKLSGDIRKEASKESPDIQRLNDAYETAKENLSQSEKRLTETNEQITLSKKIIQECNEYLRGLPNVELLEARRAKLKQDIDDKEEKLKQKRKDIRTFIREHLTYFHLYSSISHAWQVIKEKKSKNQLPPNIDKKFLKQILVGEHCLVCNRPLTEQAKHSVELLLSQLELSNEVSHTLVQMEVSLSHIIDKIKEYPKIKEKMIQALSTHEKELEQLQGELDKINNELAGYSNTDLIAEKHKLRDEHEKLLEKNKETKIRLEDTKKKQIAEVNEAKEKLDQAVGKIEKVKQIKEELVICEKALTVLKNLKNEIMTENRLKIQEQTQETFMSLVWKENTFKAVTLDDNYSLGLTHIQGYECLGSCSAAERALLALSFTLALHQVSGFLSPLVIDTPVSRISDENRKNFANVLKAVSSEKQIILLFTPDEYSEEVKKVFDPICSTKYILETINEKMTVTKEVR